MGNLLFSYFLFIVVAISGTLGNRASKTTSTTAKPFSDLLSKFHQNDYKLNFERAELIRSNASFGNFQIRTFKFNRTTPVVNASFIYTIDVGNDLEVISQVYKFASNEYREFPIRCQLNFCEILASKAFGFDSVSNEHGNVVCPFVKGKKYYFSNFAPDDSKLPPFIPNGKYMLEFQFLYHSIELFVVNNYGTHLVTFRSQNQFFSSGLNPAPANPSLIAVDTVVTRIVSMAINLGLADPGFKPELKKRP